MIKTKKLEMDGAGRINYVDACLNEDEISSAVECGFEHRPYNGSVLVVMKNGEKLYTSLKIEDL